MNTPKNPFRLNLLTLTLLLSTLNPQLSTIRAQGSLTPPGAPAPTMKSLQQIEPRIDLATVPGSASVDHIISTPGSYYLSENLPLIRPTGIEIRASGVTLDLMGFRIHSPFVGANINVITIPVGGLRDITIRNGHITGPNIASGIVEQASPDPVNIRVVQVSVSACSQDGINLGINNPSASVDHCSVRGAGGFGIRAGEVSHSTALECGGIAILAAGNVSSCRGGGTGTDADGIVASGNVSNSYGSSTGTDENSRGIDSLDGNVSNSRGTSAGGVGIRAVNVTNSFGETTGTDIGADGIDARYSVTNSAGRAPSGHDGISAQIISYSFGFSGGSGVGLRCSIAVACTSSGGEIITNRYLMP